VPGEILSLLVMGFPRAQSMNGWNGYNDRGVIFKLCGARTELT
jgi:hypothetical protein